MKKIALLFPGQGSQYVGMGKELCENYKIAELVFDEANEALGFDLKKLCFEGSMDELTKTENTQPAILTASVAAFKVFMKEFGVEPLCMAGHSLGEISALTCAEGIGFSDAVRIVRRRGEFMQNAVPVSMGAMSAVSGVPVEMIEESCRKVSTESGIVVVSNYNSREQIVISGHKEAVSAAGEILKGAGAHVIPLKVSAPFHSPLMQPAADMLLDELQKYAFNRLKYKVVSNVSAMPYLSYESIPEYLSHQIVQAVQWKKSMEYLAKLGVEAVVELGPQTVLRNLMKKNVQDIKVFSFDNSDDVKSMIKTLKVQIENLKEKKMFFISRCMGIAVCTRNRNWDNAAYEKGVSIPYREVKQMLEQLESEQAEPDVTHIKKGLDMLTSVFHTKQLPIEEQRERYQQLFQETSIPDIYSDLKIPE